MYLFGGARIKGVQLPFQLLNNTDNPAIRQSDEIPLCDQANENSQRDLPEVSVHNFVDVLVDHKIIEIVENKEKYVASEQLVEETPAILETGQPPMNVLVHLTHVNLSEMNISVLEERMYHSFPGLESLVLSMNEIEKIPEDMPDRLPHLKTLWLDGNRLKSLPDTMGQWKMLQDLRLGSEWGGNLLEYLPESMNQLSALVELDLSCNRIKNLSPGVFGSRLKYLSLASNVLKNLSGDPFFRCEDLETINLSKNNLGSLCQHFTNRMLQLSRIKLSLIDLSHNRLCILPFELIDQEKVDTIIHGNPLIQHPNQEGKYFEAAGRLLQKAIPSNSKIRTEDYSQLDPVYGDYIDVLLQFHAPATDSDEHLPPVDLSFLDYSPNMVHSLKEITLRNTASHSPSVVSYLPSHIVSTVEHKGCCLVCKEPYLDEWVSSVQMKQYHGNFAVSKIRFCSARCRETYRHNMKQRANELQDFNHHRKRALQFVEQEEPLEPGSLGWTMAAITASREQHERMDTIAIMV